jgi:outer membrane protein assembly factor BamB
MSMNRRAFASLLLAALPAGCGWFDKTKARLPGQRISVLGLDRVLEPDPGIASSPITLPPPVVNADWPESGGYPNHAMYHLALPARLTKAWEVSVGDGTGRYHRLTAQPVVDGNRVYAMDGGVQVGAYDTRDGHQIWQVDLKPKKELGNGFGGGPAFWNGRLYVGTGYGEVLALDPANGKVIWRRSVTAPIHAAVTVSDGRVFAVNVENELDVLATEDGRRLWSHNGIPETADLLGGASPAVEGEIVVVPYTSGELYALRVENGRAVWSDNLASTRAVDAVASLADIRGRPVIDRGMVFAISHSGRMAAIDVRTGERAWEQAIGSSHGVWVAGGYVYVLSDDNELVCLTRKGGKIRWVRGLPAYEDQKEREDPIFWSGPVLGSNRLIVVSSDGTAVSVSPYTGAPLGRQEIASGTFLDPVIANNTLYLLTDDANLTAYR